MYSFLSTTLTDSDLLPACDGIEQSWLSSDTDTHMQAWITSPFVSTSAPPRYCPCYDWALASNLKKFLCGIYVISAWLGKLLLVAPTGIQEGKKDLCWHPLSQIHKEELKHSVSSFFRFSNCGNVIFFPRENFSHGIFLQVYTFLFGFATLFICGCCVLMKNLWR